MAARMYKDDYDEFPLFLSNVNNAYVKEPRVFVCPSDPVKGQHPGNPRIEGTLYLTTGVSYDYVPEWLLTRRLGWWEDPPTFGNGKWDDLTPLIQCHWHWAGRYNPALQQNEQNARGWVMVGTAGASVRRYRVEDPIDLFTPDKLR